MRPCTLRALSAVLTLSSVVFAVPAQGQLSPARRAALDRDLPEVTVAKLEGYYAAHRYTVTEVVEWHLARIDRYNGIYHAVQTVDRAGARKRAAEEDHAAAGTKHGPLWGVPIVIKTNTSIAGLVTTDGWKGYTIPGHEFVAPRDATVVARLRAAGAIILGNTNMPDFAASDTNRSTAFGRTGNAYDVRFSPGGSSGGTVTAVTANMAVLGTGTDTGNSIRMPAATSAVVGVFPTRGLVSIAGIAPLDWLLDNTGPIARNVADAAIGLTVMSGQATDTGPNDPTDPRTAEAAGHLQPGPYSQYLKADALKGKRFGVPAFILAGGSIPFQGIPFEATPEQFEHSLKQNVLPLEPETRAAFLKALDGMRAAGATIVINGQLLPESFAAIARHVCTLPYVREGTERYLREFGPAQYHSPEEYEKAVGAPLPEVIMGGPELDEAHGGIKVAQRRVEDDPSAEREYTGPKRQMMAAYLEAFDRWHLDGLVYPATQMPPPDESMPQYGHLSEGPHSDTSWVNMIGVPAVVVSGGFYPWGMPFGLELATRPWHDGDLLGWAYAYEEATHHRHPPELVEKGLLPDAPHFNPQ